MDEELTYTCRKCGEVHRGLPDFGYDAPAHYYDVPEAQRETRTKHNSDFCIVDDEHYFIRVVLLVPIIGRDDNFGWGVWSSLSEQNFQRYGDLFHAEDVTGDGPFFGWLSNTVPFYPDALNQKLMVHLQSGGMRPRAELEPTDHPLSIDQRNGISLDRAIDIAEALLHPDGAQDQSPN